MNISDASCTGTSSTSTTTATTATTTTYWASNKACFTLDSVMYLKRQQEEFGITLKAEHAAQ
ncbi:hypothetical protein HDU77_000931, partial [Chytriomyces hyalinus]